MEKKLRAWDFAIKFFEVQALKQNIPSEEARLYGAKMALILNLKKNGYRKPKRKVNYSPSYSQQTNNEIPKEELIKIYTDFLKTGWNDELDHIIKNFFDRYAHKIKKSQLYNYCKFYVAKTIADTYGIDCLHRNYKSWYERKKDAFAF